MGAGAARSFEFPTSRLWSGAGRGLRGAAILAFALALVACDTLVPPSDGTAPRAPASAGHRPPTEPDALPPDAETLKTQAYYRQIEINYLSQGSLRTDGGGPDTPYGAGDLAENFLKIAFYDEFADRGGQLVAGGGEQRLQRWQRPVRVGLTFGPTVPLADRRRDRTEIAAYLARLSRLTGLPIGLTERNPNFMILILAPAERRAATPAIRAFAPGTSQAALTSVTAMRPDIYCTVFSYTAGQSPIYYRALAVIRGELPPLMTQACLHEEIAQGLGLVNDSPRARPSIFNDNEEFALLTSQDELMLRMLYDSRLRPGMTLDEARPIVADIAAGLLPGDS